MSARANQAFAAAFVDELALAGVRHACLSPGSRSAPLAVALAADTRIDVHVVLDERSAGFLALGIAKGSGEPAVVACTSGTAAANLHPAVLEAHHARTPVVVVTADRPPELRDTGALQTIDQIKLFGGAVRWFVDVEAPRADASPSYWRSLAARACAAATGSPAGPVHVNVPFREPLVDSVTEPEPAPPGRAPSPWTTGTRGLAAANDAEVTALAADIAATERGAIVAGAGAEDPEAIGALARAAAWPLLADPTSNARAGEHAISTYDALLRSEDFARDHRPDLIVRMGAAPVSKPLGAWARGARQVLVDRDGLWIDPTRAVERVVTADPARLCEAVIATRGDRSAGPWLLSWLAAEEAARGAVADVLDAEETASEPRTARDIARALPAGATLVVASSMPIRDLDSFMEPRAGLRVLANRGANGIDGFVSTALGAALASPEPTVALAGDLAVVHDSNGFLSARREHVDATFVVLNNDGGGVFSFLPYADGSERFERLFATPQGVRFDALAALYGLHHMPVARAAELPDALARALSEGGVHLIEVTGDRAANAALHERLWSAVADAVR